MNEIPGSGFYKSENYKTITTANGEILAFREVDNEIDSVMTKEEAITILCAIDVPEGNNAFIDKKAHQAIQMAIDALSIEYASDSSEIPKDLEEAAENYIAPIENEDGLKVINFSGQDIKDAFIAGWKAKEDAFCIKSMLDANSKFRDTYTIKKYILLYADDDGFLCFKFVDEPEYGSYKLTQNKSNGNFMRLPTYLQNGVAPIGCYDVVERDGYFVTDCKLKKEARK